MKIIELWSRLMTEKSDRDVRESFGISHNAPFTVKLDEWALIFITPFLLLDVLFEMVRT